jgi:hypothetical protein
MDTVNSIRLFAFCVGSAVSGICVPSVGTNFSDQWWNPNESGWGASILQQSDIIFVDLFVYGSDGLPTWFTASASPQGGGAPGHVVFAGDLYRTNGPWFAGPFNPNFVTYRKVGTLTFDADSVDTANLSYTVDGLVVSKAVTRQLWKFEDFSGSYYGGFTYDFARCTNSASNGHVEELGPVSINHSGNGTLTIFTQTSDHSCTFVGSYSQAGHVGTTQGTFTCTDGIVGTFTAFELERNGNGMTGRIVGQDNFCDFTGRFGGLLR